MNKRTGGAWIISHTKKLQEITNNQEFEDIEVAGKCGIFLSNLAASDVQSELNEEKVSAIAKASNIKKTEIETIKRKLAEAKLIETAKNGAVSVLGITTSTVLTHTADIFSNLKPGKIQLAALELSENVSDLPKQEKHLKEQMSDKYKLSTTETSDLFAQSEEIGFVDFELLEDKTRVYFNGNLFRNSNISKVNAVLSSLKSQETTVISEFDSLLNRVGCVSLETANKMLSDALLSKLQSIGMYDLNEVSNTNEARTFVTKPSAFSKFGNPFEEDALDLAKAFVSALYYGMNYSKHSRGKIRLLHALLRKLINGFEVGPATAIGEDYKLLELKRVIQLRHDSGSKYYMTLLKKDVGEIAIQVLEKGDATEQTVLGSGSITNYVGPEQKRVYNRKKQTKQSKQSVVDLLRTIRS